MWSCVWVHIHMCVNTRTTSDVISQTVLSFSFRLSLSLAWNSLTKEAGLAGQQDPGTLLSPPPHTQVLILEKGFLKLSANYVGQASTREGPIIRPGLPMGCPFRQQLPGSLLQAFCLISPKPQEKRDGEGRGSDLDGIKAPHIPAKWPVTELPPLAQNSILNAAPQRMFGSSSRWVLLPSTDKKMKALGA